MYTSLSQNTCHIWSCIFKLLQILIQICNSTCYHQLPLKTTIYFLNCKFSTVFQYIRHRGIMSLLFSKITEPSGVIRKKRELGNYSRKISHHEVLNANRKLFSRTKIVLRDAKISKNCSVFEYSFSWFSSRLFPLKDIIAMEKRYQRDCL